jgi:hypothetical protein
MMYLCMIYGDGSNPVNLTDAEARASCERAVSLARLEPEERLLLRRLAELPR